MIVELFQYLTTPCPWRVRKMGYLSEWIGIRARHQRCQKEWEPHLEKCRNSIVQFLRSNPQAKSVIFCGSGWGLDIPWDSEEFRSLEKVVFIDLIHPWSIRRKAWHNDRIEVLTGDLSGVIRNLEGAELPKPSVDLRIRADLVVSLNVLGQLPLMPVEFVEKSAPKYSEKEIRNWSKEIQKEHLRSLKEWAPRQLIIADIEEFWRDRQGTVSDKVDPWDGLRHFEMDDVWEWTLAPFGEIEVERSKIHRVGSKAFNRETFDV